MEKRKRPPLPLDASPQEKYDNLILWFFEKWQEKPGRMHNSQIPPKELSQLGFIDWREYYFYLRSLLSKELLNGIGAKENVHGVKPLVEISFDGLNYCLSLLESGKNSNKCFVAMKYKDDMERFYDEGIFPAVEIDNPFKAVRIDREHAENEQTINDFIIASIKQSRFCVADLTHKSHGAYFEAGYALGRGLKVIYTCRADHFEEVHFDLKNMQIIKYATPEELREALSLKIQAVVVE